MEQGRLERIRPMVQASGELVFLNLCVRGLDSLSLLSPSVDGVGQPAPLHVERPGERRAEHPRIVRLEL